MVHRKPFKSKYELSEYESKKRKGLENKKSRKIRDDGENKKLDEFVEGKE